MGPPDHLDALGPGPTRRAFVRVPGVGMGTGATTSWRAWTRADPARLREGAGCRDGDRLYYVLARLDPGRVRRRRKTGFWLGSAET